VSDYLENNIQEVAAGQLAAILQNNGFNVKPQKNTADNIEVIEVSADKLVEVATFLKMNVDTHFDILFSVSGIDAGESLIAVYHLFSTQFKNNVILKVWLDRSQPEIASLSQVYSASNWHERETFDLLGIKFINHPDLKRILLPEEWIGHPLRKDYVMNDSRLVWNKR